MNVRVGDRSAAALREIRTTDLAVYRAIAASGTPTLDRALRGLSRAADKSCLWAAVAAPLAMRRGATRQAAALGMASIAVSSLTVNLVGKRLLPRTRPDRTAAAVPLDRRVRMPASGSF